MTDAVQIALIASGGGIVVGIVPGIVAAIAAGAARRAAERAEQIAREGTIATKETHRAVDGRMTEMLELTRDLAHRSGVAEQKAISDKIEAAVRAAAIPTVIIAQPQMPSVVERQEKESP